MSIRALLAIAILLGTTCPIQAQLTVDRQRCEYLINPLGIDAAAPRLSWIVQSPDRGQKQTAYQVLVATTPERLATEQGDLWDSGKVASDRTLNVQYAGKPLASRAACWWKVRAWDKDGRPSTWSQPAQWTMGLLRPSDWNARWIAYPDSSKSPPRTPHNGYHSALATSADSPKWLVIDLGAERTIDAARLYSARPFDWSNTADRPYFLFPVRFRIEAARKADFSDAKIVVDCTAADVPHTFGEALPCGFEPLTARYVRLTVTRLARRDGNNFGFALAEMQVLSGGKNVAEGTAVTALDSTETAAWSTAKLVDGRLLPDPGNVADTTIQPATMVRKEFDLQKAIKRATVSVTGLGLYELRLNGQRVGDHLLAPEWTRYSKRIQYQTFDVTKLLRQGKNAVGAQISGGWWTGPLMLKPMMSRARFCLLMRLDVEMADGATQTIVTDGSWQATTDGPIRRTGIYFGETYDGAKAMPGWDQPGFAAAAWRPAQVLPSPDECENAVLSAKSNEPIRVVEELRPVKMTEPKPGVYVFDMGQNMVGWCRLTADAPAGTKITLHYAEVLNDDGTIYTANLRGADQVNQYTWRGGLAVVEPHFTYHGFRYVELTGVTRKPAQDAVVGRVFHSAAPPAGQFSCSSELVNKIMHCVDWVQRANMMSVPTDCPQRTEREGWLGDIQAFSQTAIFQRDMAGFFTKWVPDLRDSQADDGRYPDVAPHISNPNVIFSGVPAWGDAGTVVPWRMYQNYADTRMLEQHFDSAHRWVDFIHAHNPDLLWRNNRANDYNDWLNGDTLILQGYPRGISAVPNELFATAFFAHSTEIVAKMAAALGRKAEAATYSRLFEGIKAAFNKAYVAADGHIRGDTQAGYALALHFNLLEAPLRPKATEHMLRAIAKYRDHPSTGIQTTHRMLLELSRNGHHEDAWRLVSLRTVPSWGYMVEMGATTIWERWDGYVKGRGFQDPGMNSFNHWAFGSVGEWVWRELAGINPDDEQPGYKHFLIRPRPCGDLAWAKARYDSIRGPIVSEWSIAGGQIHLHVEVAANTTATVIVPTSNPAAVSEGGKAAGTAAGVTPLGPMAGGGAAFAIASGHYDFVGPK